MMILSIISIIILILIVIIISLKKNIIDVKNVGHRLLNSSVKWIWSQRVIL